MPLFISLGNMILKCEVVVNVKYYTLSDLWNLIYLNYRIVTYFHPL